MKKGVLFSSLKYSIVFFPLLAPTTLPVQYLTVYLSHAVCRQVFGSVFRIQIRTDPHKEMPPGSGSDPHGQMQIRIRIQEVKSLGNVQIH